MGSIGRRFIVNIVTLYTGYVMSESKENWISQLPQNLAKAGLLQFALAPTLILLDRKVGPRELRVFLCLSMHASAKTGICYPSQKRIAEMCGYMRKDKPDATLVSLLIKKLVERGWIKNLGQRGFKKTNIYRLQIPEHGDFRSVSGHWKDFKADASDEEIIRLEFEAEGFSGVEDYIDFTNQEGVYLDPIIYNKMVERRSKDALLNFKCQDELNYSMEDVL